MGNKKKILWVDDEPIQVITWVQYLEDVGYEMELVKSPSECMQLLKDKQYDAVILDVMMVHGDELDERETKGGHHTGPALARLIRKQFPGLPLVGCSVRTDKETIEWFHEFGAGYWPKHEIRPSKSLADKVSRLLDPSSVNARTFIVHGHAEKEKLELKNFLQNTLNFEEPVILHERPSSGRTIIEKFEEESDDINLVFVLLTPDDKIANNSDAEETKSRARQNVIYEMGYFHGKLKRRSGRILLLYKGKLDLPNDISGIIYINIDNGIDAAGTEIRRELIGFL